VLCGGIGRTPGGVINRFNNTLINIGGTKTKGYDLNVNWALPQTGIGQFGLSWQNTWLDSYLEIFETEGGTTEVERAGTERGSPSVAFPKWKSSLTTDWRLGGWSAAATVRYTDSLDDTCRNAVGLGICTDEANNFNKMDATAYVDLQASWAPAALDNNWTFTVGINNLLNQDPPNCFSCELNSFDAATYDVPGMFWYARLVARFGKD
jgi:iron complex outermembrane receptor protein